MDRQDKRKVVPMGICLQNRPERSILLGSSKDDRIPRVACFGKIQLFKKFADPTITDSLLPKLLFQPPHPDIAPTGNRLREPFHVRKKPPVRVPLVPETALFGVEFVFGDYINRLVVGDSDETPPPYLDLIPIP